MTLTSVSFKKILRITRLLFRHTKKEKRREITKIRNDIAAIAIDITENKIIKMENYEVFSTNKFDTLINSTFLR